MADQSQGRSRSRSGPNIPEAQRGSVKVQLRLPPEYAEELDALAARYRITRSGVVALLLDRADGREPRTHR